MRRPRIVVTGVGAISGIGSDAAENWQAMKKGRSGIGPLAIPHREDLRVTIGAQIAELPDIDVDRRIKLTTGRYGHLAMIAAKQALEQAGLKPGDFEPHRAGVVIGTGIYGGDVMEEAYRAIFLEGRKRTGIFVVPQVMPSSPAVHVSMAFGLKGPVFATSSACSSSNHAFASALDVLRAGRADMVVAGGTDAPLCFGVLKAWDSMRILAKTGCRPFSADREGLVLGDGAGAVVLETETHAKARGAVILAELAGAGMTADAGDIVAPDRDGAASAMTLCLADAGLAPEDVDYLNAHGTGTMGNDRTETEAIRQAFGAHADRLPVSSTKSMHGHCMGASGALEMVAAIGALREGIIPPTLNLHKPDPHCDLDYVPHEARAAHVSAVVSNSFAFGGSNAVIALKAA